MCPLINSSSTKLECKFASNLNLEPNIQYQFQVLVKNLGYALQNGSFSIRFLPLIESITPTSGSLAGGTLLKITGKGFIRKTTSIKIGETTYFQDGLNTNITYDLISLLTNSELNNTYEVNVYSNFVQAVCLVVCNFTYSANYTPVISSISPISINSSSQVSIKGSNFGTNISSVNIDIGGQECVIDSLNDSQLACLLNGINLGIQQINLNINGN